MGIMTRFTRICRADLHGVMDQLEDKSLVLKQCLREMEESIVIKQAGLTKMSASLDRIKHEHQNYKSEQKKLEQDLDAALKKDKDHIARILIKKLKTMEQHINILERRSSALEMEISGQSEYLESQKHQYEQLKLRSETFFQAKEQQSWEETMTRAMPQTINLTLSEEEVELELIKRKEALQGGG
jgi:phage shock protein A